MALFKLLFIAFYLIFSLVTAIGYGADSHSTNSVWNMFAFLVIPILWFYVDFISSVFMVQTTYYFGNILKDLRSNMFTVTNLVRVVAVLLILTVGTCEDYVYTSGICSERGRATGVAFLLTSCLNTSILMFSCHNMNAVIHVLNDKGRFHWQMIVMLSIRFIGVVTAITQIGMNDMDSMFLVNFVIHIILIPAISTFNNNPLDLDNKMEPLMSFYYIKNDRTSLSQANTSVLRFGVATMLKTMGAIYILLIAIMAFANDMSEDTNTQSLYDYQAIIMTTNDVRIRFIRLLIFAVYTTITGVEMSLQNTDMSEHYGKLFSRDRKGFRPTTFYGVLHFFAYLTFGLFTLMMIIATLRYDGISTTPAFLNVLEGIMCFSVGIDMLRSLSKAYINFNASHIYSKVDRDETKINCKNLSLTVLGLHDANIEYFFMFWSSIMSLVFLSLLIWKVASNEISMVFQLFFLYVGLSRFWFYFFLNASYFNSTRNPDDALLGFTKLYFGELNEPLRNDKTLQTKYSPIRV